MNNIELNTDDFWHRVRVLANKRNILQKDWCADLGYDPQFISNKISRKMFPVLEDIVKIAAYFDVSLDFLIFGKDEDKQDKLSDLEERLSQIAAIVNR